MNPFSALSRELSWQLKQTLRYSPAVRSKSGTARPERLLAQFTAEQTGRYNALNRQFLLTEWPRLCNETEFRENLYVLDVLDQHLGNPSHNGPGLDIGCRNFSHLPALSAWSAGPWHGVELDAHARSLNGFTRCAYGQWMARQVKGAAYFPGSVLDVQGVYHTIVWILPFVLPGALEYWGLPSRYFEPERLLDKACDLLAPGGQLLIINQGEAEAEEQHRLLSASGLPAFALGEITSGFSPFRMTRFGWLVKA